MAVNWKDLPLPVKTANGFGRMLKLMAILFLCGQTKFRNRPRCVMPGVTIPLAIFITRLDFRRHLSGAINEVNHQAYEVLQKVKKGEMSCRENQTKKQETAGTPDSLNPLKIKRGRSTMRKIFTMIELLIVI